MADGDAALAAEPGFHGEPPQGSDVLVASVRHRSDSTSKITERQSKNVPPLVLSPTQALGVVVAEWRDLVAVVINPCPGAPCP